MLDFDALGTEKLRPLKRAEYERLAELGVFDEERVELLYGMLVSMSPQGTEHAALITAVAELFIQQLGTRATVRVQMPFVCVGESEPEPDIAIVARSNYRDAHPSSALMIVEVADSSARKDRETKARLYAESGVPEYWLFFVDTETLEIRRSIENGRYVEVTTHHRGERMRPLAFDDLIIDLAELWSK